MPKVPPAELPNPNGIIERQEGQAVGSGHALTVAERWAWPLVDGDTGMAGRASAVGKAAIGLSRL